MSDTIYSPIINNETPPAPDVALQESKSEWQKVVDEQAGVDNTPFRDAREAAQELTRKRRERGEDNQEPLIERRYGHGAPKELKLRDASADLSFTRSMERGKEWLDRGVPPEQAMQIAQAPEEPPSQVGLVDKGKLIEPLGADERVTLDDALSPLKAAKLLGNYREAAAAEQQRFLAELSQQQQAEPAQAVPAPEPQPEPQPSQPDPVAEEHSRIAAARQAHEHLARVTAAEVQLASQIAAAKQAARSQLADLRSPDDVARLQQTDPRRFAAIMQADQQVRAAEQQLALLDQNRRAHEGQLAQHQQAEEHKAFSNWKEQQNTIAEQQIPELKAGGEQAKALRAAVRDLVTENAIDLSDPTIARAIYSVEGQKILADAARWRMAQASMRNVQRAPVPPVVRPGVARPAGAVDHARLSDLSRAVDRPSPVQLNN